MIAFKCKMCGGDLEVTEGSQIATCEYCMTKQTIPSSDDEKRAKLYNRANHFRRNSEFDRALGVYEQILTEDSEDAEVYWEIVLSKYGIQYVEDPESKVQKPTVNRTQTASILNDADYHKTLELADASRREIYEREANEIDRIQSEIFFIARNEKPYDIFISYKEKAYDGRRTEASYISESLYNQLTKEGYRVFFSRISLENVIGQKYEPYIYSALRSAKVMLVIGTKKDEFEAPWVRNEWSRFLNMNRNNLEKCLITCFQDINGSDLPEELRGLQGEDMSKMGFERKLLSNVEKIIKVKQVEQPVSVQPTTKVITKTSAGVTLSLEALLENAVTFITLGDYESAFRTYKEITQKYPAEWKGWWGLIRACTIDFRQTDFKKIKVGKSDMHNWFKNVRKLANEEQLVAPLETYRIYWRRVSAVVVEDEAEKVKEEIKKSEAEKEKIENSLESVRKNMTTERKPIDRRMDELNKSIRACDQLIEGLNDDVEACKRLIKIGWSLIIVPWVTLYILALMIPGTEDNAVLEVVLAIIVYSSTAAGIIALILCRRRGPLGVKRNELEKQNGERRTFENQLEDINKRKRDLEENYKKQKERFQPQFSQIQKEIELYQRYLRTDVTALEELAFAFYGQQFGDDAKPDQALMEIREKLALNY